MRSLSDYCTWPRARRHVSLPDLTAAIAKPVSAFDIRIVLVEPSHPGNIGAAARAMKNMGLASLTLVRPKDYPHSEATARASGAADVLASARVVDSVAAALEGCSYVAATTARERDQYFRVLDVREAATRLVAEAQRAPVAVLFGAERSGLANEHLDAAHVLIRIPASTAYASLNLAMSVQLVAYEIFRAAGQAAEIAHPALAPPEEMQRLYEHLGEVLGEIDFRDRTESGVHLMQRIRRFLQRAELDSNEVNILRGMLTAVQSRRRRAGELPQKAPEPIYLDHAATTPVDAEVAREMSRDLTAEGNFGNPASTTHVYGLRAAERVAAARQQVAALIGAHPEEITFTSGATESNNLAILGVARANAHRGRHLVTSRIEHKAVLDPCRQLEREGWSVSWITPDHEGLVAPEHVRAALRPDTVLVSLMHVNNEVGVIEDITAIGRVCRERGVLFHTDAAQSVGKVPIDLAALPVDLLSLTAHKIYGPKGIGALYVRRSARPYVQPITFGGGHERGLRPGTLATNQVVGLGAACARAAFTLSEEAARLTDLRRRLWEGLVALGGVHHNGPPARCVPGILNVSIEGVEGESLVKGLVELAVSTGSACNSANGEPSFVLRALGRSTELAQSSLRFGLGRGTTESDVQRAIAAVGREVRRLRALSPASPFEPDSSWRSRAHVQGEAGSEAVGAWIRFHLSVSGDTVKDARVQAYGCPHTLDVAGWLNLRLVGRRRTELVPEDPLMWARLRQVPTEKLGRLLLIEDALRNCVTAWPSDLMPAST
jgi:cysteine desulfurase